MLKKIAYLWGILGVLAILLSAIIRLSSRILDMLTYSLTPLQWSVLFGFALYMAYAEGYKGFYLNFSPRVIARASYFCKMQSSQPPWLHFILAPALCMGFIHADKRRKIIALTLTSLIILLVILVSTMPQPWRGIIDAGVVLGLLLGVISILYFWVLSWQEGWRSPVSPDFPNSDHEGPTEDG